MKTAIVVCPGRGTYNKTELGYIHTHHAARWDTVKAFDTLRMQSGQPTLSDLDGASEFSVSTYSRGDNASALIFAASYLDYLVIGEDRLKVVAITGNSMGWYTALACAGALPAMSAFALANTMGQLMQETLIGGQLVYPFMAEDWQPDLARKSELLSLVAYIGQREGHHLALSIDLGGMLVIAGNEAGLMAFEASVPVVQGRFPMRLSNHAAFHSSLQQPVSDVARTKLAPSLFIQPELPLIDGRGAIWWPGATNHESLWDYTLGAQITTTYNLTLAVAVAAREFAPDAFVLLGPGNTMGGVVAQSLILANWQDVSSKQTFQQRQAGDPVLLSMGIAEHRPLAIT